MNFPLQQIYQTIDSKRDLYNQIAAKTHKVEDDNAAQIISSELENYLIRLEKYWSNPQAHKNGEPTLTVAQGVNIFLEVIQSGLSFSEIANHIYLSRLKGTGTAVGYQITADGLVYLAIKAGAIDHLSEPTIVQTGEQFAIMSTPDGKQFAQHNMIFDGKPPFSFNQFLVGYVYIVYPNGDRELSWISNTRLAKYKAKSLNQSMYNDESFIQTKIIKHALRKVRKTPFMQKMLAEDDEIIQENRIWEDNPATYDERETYNNTVEPF